MKVYIASMLIELPDDAPEPNEDDWLRVMHHIPHIEGVACMSFEPRPFTSMEDDPITHTHH